VLDADVTITAEMAEYFAKLEQQGVDLSREQKAWYVKKAEQQKDKMKQEFPSTPDEAFEAAIEGAYFSPQMRKLRAEGRICRDPDPRSRGLHDLGPRRERPDDDHLLAGRGPERGRSTTTRTAARASATTPGC
jgi:hypothetical protein